MNLNLAVSDIWVDALIIMLGDFEFACRYSHCKPGMFSTERSVEIKCYNKRGELDLDYVAIHKDQVDENLGLVGIGRVRNISDNHAEVDINDSQGSTSLKIPLKDLVQLT